MGFHHGLLGPMAHRAQFVKLSAMSLRRLLLALSLCLSTVSLGACADSEICTAIYMPALNVTVVDSDGMALDAAVVTYTHDGGASVSCGTGASLSCGNEGSGDYAVSAEVEGYESASVMVTVEEDGCDVLTEDVTLMLASAP